MKKTTLIYIYECHLINKSGVNHDAINQICSISDALEVLRYAFETYAGFTPEQTIKNINDNYIKALRLQKIITIVNNNKRITNVIDKYKYDRIVFKMYPQLTEKYTVIHNVLRLKNAFDEKEKGNDVRFIPYKTYNDRIDKLSAAACLRYVLNRFFADKSAKYIYGKFKHERNYLKYYLYSYCYYLFESQVDYLYHAGTKEIREYITKIRNNDKTEIKNNNLGAKLEAIRLDKGLTCKEAAKLSGVGAKTIRSIEKSRQSPIEATLNKLCKAYNVDKNIFKEKKWAIA